jgi:hypothetical protein
MSEDSEIRVAEELAHLRAEVARLTAELNTTKEAYIQRGNSLWEIVGPTTLWGEDVVTSIRNQFNAMRKDLAEERKQRSTLEELYNAQQETLRALWDENTRLTVTKLP